MPNYGLIYTCENSQSKAIPSNIDLLKENVNAKFWNIKSGFIVLQTSSQINLELEQSNRWMDG